MQIHSLRRKSWMWREQSSRLQKCRCIRFLVVIVCTAKLLLIANGHEFLQMKEIQDKIVRFEELDLQMEKEWQQLEQMKNLLFVDQVSVLSHKSSTPKAGEPKTEEHLEENVKTDWCQIPILFLFVATSAFSTDSQFKVIWYLVISSSLFSNRLAISGKNLQNALYLWKLNTNLPSNFLYGWVANIGNITPWSIYSITILIPIYISYICYMANICFQWKIPLLVLILNLERHEKERIRYRGQSPVSNSCLAKWVLFRCAKRFFHKGLV